MTREDSAFAETNLIKLPFILKGLLQIMFLHVSWSKVSLLFWSLITHFNLEGVAKYVIKIEAINRAKIAKVDQITCFFLMK
jgi:hypothetical protein